MKSLLNKILALSLLTVLTVTLHAKPPKRATWHFNNLDGWVLAHQDKNPESQTIAANGKLHMFTRANSWDRKKVRTVDKIYTTGNYKWRTYIPIMGEGDQASIGSWIYNDDQHEIDFEVGSGNKAVRKELGAAPDEMVAYATTQANPYKSVPVLIDKGWHIFEIDITLVDGNYFVEWLIDGKVISSVQQTFGEEFPFYVFCSVENLKFIGDHQPKKNSYAVFDYVRYKYHE